MTVHHNCLFAYLSISTISCAFLNILTARFLTPLSIEITENHFLLFLQLKVIERHFFKSSIFF